MTAADEDALTCDFAETYQILNWRELSPELAATLAIGLRDSSRIKQKLSGQSYTLDTLLTAAIVERLGYVLTILSHGKIKPKSIVKTLTASSEKKKTQNKTFATLEDFKRAYQDITGGED